jgi:hypothetical protein
MPPQHGAVVDLGLVFANLDGVAPQDNAVSHGGQIGFELFRFRRKRGETVVRYVLAEG